MYCKQTFICDDFITRLTGEKMRQVIFGTNVYNRVVFKVIQQGLDCNKKCSQRRSSHEPREYFSHSDSLHMVGFIFELVRRQLPVKDAVYSGFEFSRVFNVIQDNT